MDARGVAREALRIAVAGHRDIGLRVTARTGAWTLWVSGQLRKRTALVSGRRVNVTGLLPRGGWNLKVSIDRLIGYEYMYPIDRGSEYMYPMDRLIGSEYMYRRSVRETVSRATLPHGWSDDEFKRAVTSMVKVAKMKVKLMRRRDARRTA
jgi:hypothetical protein